MPESLEKAVQDAIERAYATAGTGDSALERAHAEVQAILQRRNPATSSRKAIAAAAREMTRRELKARDERERVAFAERSVANAEQLREIANATDEIARRAEARTNDISRRMLNIVTETSRRYGRNATGRRIAEAAARKISTLERHAKTEVDTARAAMDNALRFRRAIESGYELMRLDGPTVNCREWCARNVHQIRTIADWSRQDNGQRLPVIPYLGGYRCRHRATAVEDQRPRNKAALLKSIEDATEDGWLDARAPEITPQQLADAFDVRVPGLKMIAESADSGSIEFHIQDWDGNSVGRLQRTFMTARDGTQEVYHDLFRLNPAYHGRGAASNVLDASVRMYDEVGVDVVHVHAALDGGHLVWAKMGFEWDDYYAGRRQRDAWAIAFGKDLVRRGVSLEKVKGLLDTLEQPIDFVSVKTNLDGVDIDGTEWKRRTPGIDWYGKLDLRTTSRRNFDNYMRRKRT